MSTVAQDFKYLWTAIFRDGTEITQPEDDHYSKHDDSVENNPSAFRDVLDKQKESKLVAFYLENVVTADRIGVDLESGQFGINSIAFEAQPQNLDLSSKELEIVFFREVRKDTVMGVADWEEKRVDHYINRYFIGWQVKGENIIQTVALS